MRRATSALWLIAPAILHAAPAAAITPPNDANDVKAGVDAWEGGDFERAASVWRPLAIAGDPDAQFNLAQAYKLGRGVEADLGQAETWYRRAAEQGHLQAEDNLGLLLFTAGRREDAIKLIERSAARGEPRAQYVLGTAMFNGELVEKDWPRAYAYTKRASDAGLALASSRLAQLDRLIPLEQRQRGLAMLPGMERSEARERLAAAAAAAPSPAAPAAPRIVAATIPASRPAATYAPPPVIASPGPQAPQAAPPAGSAPAVPETPPAAKLSPAGRAAAQAAIEATAKAGAASNANAAPGTSDAPPPASPLDRPKPAVPAASADGPRKAAQPAPPAAPASEPGRWRAQLGAFSIEANARKLWTALESRHDLVAARQPYLVKSGSLTRLQAGSFATRAEAASFCAVLQKAGQPCLAVER